jgi:hypothetical protein
MQDTLTCHTSTGLVILADQRNVTYVNYNDVFYALGEAVSDPTDNQTTWGCSIGDASIEVYETGDGLSKDLAARIHHRSIGTVSVKLTRIDQEPELFASIAWGSNGSGRLKIDNKSAQDLFTWKLVCPVNYEITLGDGSTIAAVQEPSGYAAVVDSAVATEGTVRANVVVDVGIKIDARIRMSGQGCVINDAIVVDSAYQFAHPADNRFVHHWPIRLI